MTLDRPRGVHRPLFYWHPPNRFFHSLILTSGDCHHRQPAKPVLSFLWMTEIQSSCHVKSSLAIPRGRYIPPKLAQEMGATEQASVYWPSWKEPLPKSPHRYDPEIRKRLIAAVRAFRSFWGTGENLWLRNPYRIGWRLRKAHGSCTRFSQTTLFFIPVGQHHLSSNGHCW